MQTSTPVARSGRLRKRTSAKPRSVGLEAGIEVAENQLHLRSPIVPQATPVALSPSPVSSRRKPTYDDEAPFISSQYQPQGEIFWNYEASPRVKEKLKKLLKAADDRSPNRSASPQSEAGRSSMDGPSAWRLIPRSSSSESDRVDPSIIQSMKDFLQRANSSSPRRRKKETSVCDRQRDDDTNSAFSDSVDDSFLIRCTQAVEQPARAAISKPDKKSQDKGNNGRDLTTSQSGQNDSFDHLLSQIGDEEFTRLRQKPAKPSSKVDESNSCSFKRFRSDNDAQLDHRKLGPMATAAAQPSLNRTLSSPEINGAVVKCSRAEIELKRQEALRRRQLSKTRPK